MDEIVDMCFLFNFNLSRRPSKSSNVSGLSRKLSFYNNGGESRSSTSSKRNSVLPNKTVDEQIRRDSSTTSASSSLSKKNSVVVDTGDISTTLRPTSTVLSRRPSPLLRMHTWSGPPSNAESVSKDISLRQGKEVLNRDEGKLPSFLSVKKYLTKIFKLSNNNKKNT
jgi:hypothetical protein